MTTADTMTPVIPATPETASGAAVRVQRMVRGHLRVTLILGDCLEIAPTLTGINALISDPPYGMNFRHSGKGSGVEGRKTRPKTLSVGGIVGDNKSFDPRPWLDYPTVVLWGANHYASRLPDSRSWLVWDKLDGLAPGSFSDCELAWMKGGGSVRMKRYMWRGICQAGEKGKKLHPCQKPVEVMAWAMDKAKVPEGATVLDPYMGSGSTGIACLRTGRNFVGIEIDPEHFKTACARLERECNQGAFDMTPNEKLTDAPR